MQSGGVQVGAPRSHTAQTLAVRAAGMSCFQARKNLFQIELEVTLRYLQNPTAGARFLNRRWVTRAAQRRLS